MLDMAIKRSKDRVDNLLLTSRESDVVRLVSTGLSNRSVAHRLGLREGTVKIHLHNIYKKLGIPNRTSLILRTVQARNEAIEG